MREKILLVDDEQNVLSGYTRQLRKLFHLETATSGAEGLELCGLRGPFAVVISDMRMPKMDGIAFLREVELQSPDTVRIMLTGNADLETCIDAINKGHIFRFLTKPCAPEDMAKAIARGIEQYRLVTSERELLHGTLTGCIRTLTDILSLMNPAAFSRGSRIRRYVRHIAAELGTPHFWEYEMAAALSQIGCVALPPELLARINEGRPLTSEQRGLFARHPGYGCQLLAEIPRLELVALIISRQGSASRKMITISGEMTEPQAVDFGAQLLRIALDLDNFMLQKKSFVEALTELQQLYGNDHPMLDALMSFQPESEDRVIMKTTAAELSSGMTAAEDILTTSGNVLVSEGQHITEPVRLHLLSCAQAHGLREPFEVEVVAEER